MLTVKFSALDEFFAAVAAKAKLYMPVDDGKGSSKFDEWKPGTRLSDATNTRRSAKDFFFPQTEDLVEFKVEGQNIEIIDNRKEAEDFVLFGVRGCDVRSFEILDRVFLSDPVDSYYKNRREHATVISLACKSPDETCFCASFGIDAARPEGDVRCYMTDEAAVFEPLTEKGKALMASLDVVHDCDCQTAAVEAQKAEIEEKTAKLPLAGLKPADFTKKQLDTFNSPKWAELSKACLGCGSCTFVCPTCQCYDIKDYDTGHGIKRYRCWDSCMYSDFTLMAAGTPRHSQLEKFRQRFMHKLVYFPMNNDGVYGCVGCGRCLKRCPISMNIVKVMKSIEEAAE